jgi:hypothetical protein
MLNLVQSGLHPSLLSSPLSPERPITILERKRKQELVPAPATVPARILQKEFENPSPKRAHHMWHFSGGKHSHCTVSR